MGLDMYLNARRWFWHSENDLTAKISASFPELADKRVKEIVAEVGYWRKANAIHKWFVHNVQGGADDCKSYTVSIPQLVELLAVVEAVLSDPSKAKELLPTSSGFFFGSTEYDQYYFEDLELTKTIVNGILNVDWKNWHLEYRASW